MTADRAINRHEFENGLVLLAEPMPWLESVAFSAYVPAGCRQDPVEKRGIANFVCEMVQRGAGELDSRAFIEALDGLGVDYGSSTSVYHTQLGGAMPAGQLHDALSIYRDVLTRAMIPESQLEDARLVCYQELRGIEDDLAQRVLVELKQRHYGQPDGRDCRGRSDTLESISLDDIRAFYQGHYRPNGMILAVAGKFDWPALKSHVNQLLGNWRPVAADEPMGQPATHGLHHIPFDSNQTHIAVAFPSASYSHADYYHARGAVGVLSDGLSSRLFTEVREKRGLCYSVFATCHSTKTKGSVICYAGTSTDRAQETLDVILDQLIGLSEGISDAELRRLKVQVRSALIMQQESCRSRAAAIAGDWFHLGRVQTLDEVTEKINRLTVQSINEYLEKNAPRQFDIVSLGKQPLELRINGVSATSFK
jgi:predicted Zn-dependent peptidase